MKRFSNKQPYKTFRRPRGCENVNPTWVAQILDINGIHPATVQECKDGRVVITFDYDHPVPGDVYARLETGFLEVNQPIMIYRDGECDFYPDSICFKLLGRSN